MLEQFLVMTLAVAHQWGKKEDPPVLIMTDNELDDLVFAEPYHLLAREIGIGFART